MQLAAKAVNSNANEDSFDILPPDAWLVEAVQWYRESRVATVCASVAGKKQVSLLVRRGVHCMSYRKKCVTRSKIVGNGGRVGCEIDLCIDIH